MFLIPLGLGSFLRKMPFAILLIVSMSIIYSSLRYEDLKNFDRETLLIHKESKEFVDRSIKDLLLLACSEEFSQKACEIINLEFQKNLDQQQKEKIVVKKSDSKVSVSERLKILDFIKNFDPEQLSQKIQASEEYREYKQLIESRKEEALSISKKYNLLSKYNISVKRLLQATFSHSGYMHLISNLAYIFLFGVFVEQRVGFFKTLFIFLVGSFFGLGVELYINSPTALLGASAGATSLIGAFFILFWGHKMKILLTLGFFYFRTFFVPVSVSIPFFYLANDITSVLSNSATGVAHYAHLFGAFFGMFFSLVYKKTDPVKGHFMFQDEYNYFHSLGNETDIHKKLAIYKKIRDCNHYNYQAFDKMLNDLIHFEGKYRLTIKEKKFINAWSYDRYLALPKDKDFSEVLQLVEKVNRVIDIKKILKRMKWQRLIKLADLSLELKMYEFSLLLYSQLIPKLRGPLKKDVKQTYNNIYNHLHSSEEVNNE